MMLPVPETVELEIRLNSSWWNTPPTCKIYLDNEVILQSCTIEGPQTVSFRGELSEGEHSIKIVRYGKNGLLETIVEDGKIVKDQLLNIEGISIDGIDLGFVTYSEGEFTDASSGNKTKETLYLGLNGTWELKFNVPTYMWLLEKL